MGVMLIWTCLKTTSQFFSEIQNSDNKFENQRIMKISDRQSPGDILV